MSLAQLPDELIEQIAYIVTNPKGSRRRSDHALKPLRNWSHTCLRYYRIVLPILYREDKKYFQQDELHRAIQGNHAGVVRRVIDAVPDVLKVGHITSAAKSKKRPLAILEALIEFDRLWNPLLTNGGIDEVGRSPLIWAAAAGWKEGACAIVRKGGARVLRPSPLQSAYGVSALSTALREGLLTLSPVLIDLDVPITPADRHDGQPFIEANRLNNNEIIQGMIDRGAKSQTPDDTHLALRCATSRRNVSVPRALLNRGSTWPVDPERLGDTIHLATRGNRVDNVFEGKEDTDAWNKTSVELVRILIEHGADLGARYRTVNVPRRRPRWTNGDEPMCCFTLQGNREGVRLLVENGVDPERGAI